MPFLREPGKAGWSVRFAEGEASWVLESEGVRRAVIPLAGARPYRIGSSAFSLNRCAADSAFTVAQGEVRIAADNPLTIHVRDVVRLNDDGLELHRSWWHTEDHVVTELELAIDVVAEGVLEEHLIPGCLYDGNRESSPDRLVPRLNGTALFEEHRCPTPLVYVRCRGRDGAAFGLGILPEPCAVVDGNVPDQWWSLGLRTDAASVTLASVSGRLAMNGEDERIYDAQNRIAPYLDAWVNARPRQVYEKHVRLVLQAQPAASWGWREILRDTIAAQPPPTELDESLLSPAALEEAVRLKTAYALGRWYDDSACAGMLWHPYRPESAKARQSVEYGWVGQNMRLGLSLWRLGKRKGDAELCRRGERCAHGWVQAAAAALSAGRVAPTHYLIGTGWRDTAGGADGYARPTTETLFELAEFCVCVRAAGSPRPDWEEVLSIGLEFYSAPARADGGGLFPLKWNGQGIPQPGPTVAAGALMVAALAVASHLPDGARWLDRAHALWTSYATVFLSAAPRHPCGSALDSCCEDMESGLFLLISGLRLAEASRRTGEPVDARLVEQVERAADWVLSWTYTWNVPLRAETLLGAAPGRFSTVGLSDVSVQNRHLHVFSASAEILRLSDLLGGAAGARYRLQAHRMLAPVIRMIARPQRRWGMDEDGEQTEQYNQTNYIQHPGDPVCRPRGGIARWFVPWITVWVLSMCLDFLDNPDTILTVP